MSKVLNGSIAFGLVSGFLVFWSFTAIAEEPPLAMGKHLLLQGNPDAAITEYKRFLFFHPDDPRVGEIYYHIGLAYRVQGLWSEARHALWTAIHHAADTESKSVYQLELAVTLIASKNYDLAQLELIKVTLRHPSGPLHRRALFLKTVAYIYQFRWAEARAVLQEYTDDEKMNALFDSTTKMPQKSARVAKVLSTILPGAGQAYTGDWRNALNAFALNATFGFLAVDAALTEAYADAILWGAVVFWRYYRANTLRAEEGAKQFNLRAARQAAAGLLQRLQEIADTP